MPREMRRPPPPVGLQPSMLRHFLLISIALTSCIAIFANGENAQLIQDELHERQAKNRALAVDKDRGRIRVVGGLQIAKGTNIEQGGGEPNGPFSDPSNGSSTSVYTPPVAQNQIAAAPVPSDPSYGTDVTGVNSAGPKPAKKLKGPVKLTAKDVERILAASRKRSGLASGE
jgi:hypothetical protein